MFFSPLLCDRFFNNTSLLAKKEHKATTYLAQPYSLDDQPLLHPGPHTLLQLSRGEGQIDGFRFGVASNQANATLQRALDQVGIA